MGQLSKRADHSTSRSDSKRDFGRNSDLSGGKASIKTSVWFMKVMKLGSISDQPTFTMHYWLKEKKQKSKFLSQKFHTGAIYSYNFSENCQKIDQ